MRKFSLTIDHETFAYTGFDKKWIEAEHVLICQIEDSLEVWCIDDSPEALAQWKLFMRDRGIEPTIYRIFEMPSLPVVRALRRPTRTELIFFAILLADLLVNIARIVITGRIW